MISLDEQIRIIAKGAEEVIDLKDLEVKLKRAQKEGRQLIVKLGLDPSAPDIHLGHAVVLRKIKQIQDLGHKVIIIIGDFTGMIGDPTGKSKTRRQLSREEVLFNAETYKRQIFKILNEQKTEVRFNSEWLSELNFNDVIELSSKCTVAKMLEREDFKNRFTAQQPIFIHEFFYPLMQAYDSIVLKADIELGGSDQRFNILMGRALQKDFGQESQVALFMPILEGTDGVEKMSKSLGNYIGINENPNDIYGKVMSIPDNMIIKFFELATDIHPDEIGRMKASLKDEDVNPRDLKMELAREVVRLYHGESAAAGAEEYFVTVFQKKIVPGDVVLIEVDAAQAGTGCIDMLKIVTGAGFAPTNSEVRRLVEQGAVKLNGDKLTTLKGIIIKDKDVLQVGEKEFCQVYCEVGNGLDHSVNGDHSLMK